MKTNNLIKKFAQHLSRHFSKEHVKMAHTWKSAQCQLIIQKMYIKIIVRYHLMAVRENIKKMINVSKDIDKRNPCTLLQEMQIDTAFTESNKDTPQRI